MQSLRSVSYTHLDVYKRQLLREDNALLLQLLQDSSATAQDGKLYVLGEEKLRKLIDSISKQLEAERNAVTIYQELEYPRLPRGVYPQYMIDFVTTYLKEQMEEVNQPYFYSDLLLMGYATYIQKHGNSFLRKWFALEYDIAAIFAAITADQFKLKREQYILGTNPLHQLLREGDWHEIAYQPEDVYKRQDRSGLQPRDHPCRRTGSTK